MVDEKYHVIDGQHRLRAAEELGLEIYYQVKKGCGIEEMIRLNSVQDNWNWLDYMNAYASEGNENYRKLEVFIKKYDLSMKMAMAVLDNDTRMKENIRDFKEGKYKYPSNDKEHHIKIQCFRNIVEMIRVKGLDKIDFSNNRTFGTAFLRFMCLDEVSLGIFEGKLMQRVDKVKKCANTQDYIRMFASIYNYKNNAPIEITSSSF